MDWHYRRDVYMDKKSILTDRQIASVRAYQKMLMQAGVAVERMIVFGSYAKGTPNKWSDLDVCVVSPQFGKHPFDEGVLLARYAMRIDEFIEPHPYNPKDLADKYDPLASEIRKYGIQVV